MNYYNIEHLLKKYPDAEYYMIYGEKSNGKTFSINKHNLQDYFERGAKSAYIRRWSEDIKGTVPSSLYNAIGSKWLEKEHPDTPAAVYYRKAWYLLDDEGKRQVDPFSFAFSIGAVDHTNGTAFPAIKNIFFDEFTTRGTYLPDEYEKFQILLSNIIRDRGDVKIFMAGNTVNKFCPYFKEIDFDPDSIKQGESILLERGQTRYAIEYAKATEGGKESDKYFYSGKTVSMITKGAWEMADYPKAPTEWTTKDVRFRVFVIFNDEYIAGDFVVKNGNSFLFFYPKKEKKIFLPDRDIVFADYSDYRRNWYSSLARPTDEISSLIVQQFQAGKVFYADNETGEILRNYIVYSVQKSGISRL